MPISGRCSGCLQPPRGGGSRPSPAAPPAARRCRRRYPVGDHQAGRRAARAIPQRRVRTLHRAASRSARRERHVLALEVSVLAERPSAQLQSFGVHCRALWAGRRHSRQARGGRCRAPPDLEPAATLYRACRISSPEPQRGVQGRACRPAGRNEACACAVRRQPGILWRGGQDRGVEWCSAR